MNCSGDGLDSNGGLYLYGGRQAVFSMASGGDNSALDADGTVLVDGAILFTAGAKGVDGTVQSGWFGSDQKYASSTTSYSAGKIINTKTGSSGSVAFSYSLPKSTNYMVASWPSSFSSSAPSFTTASSVTVCKGGSWSHNWDSGTVTVSATSTSAGSITYTCDACGETETQTIPMIVEIPVCDHSVEISETPDEGYLVTFAGDSGVSSITVYATQDYTGASESVDPNGTTVTRDGSSGDPDSTGDGQINFTIVLAEGYTLSSLTATAGTYKNIKGPADTSVAAFEAMFNVSQDGYVSTVTSGRLVGTGSVLMIHDSHGEVVKEYTVVMFGDLDGNGRINASDISIAYQAVSTGFDDEIFRFAANIVRTGRNDRFTAADISALCSAITDEPIDQAELAQICAYSGW